MIPKNFEISFQSQRAFLPLTNEVIYNRHLNGVIEMSRKKSSAKRNGSAKPTKNMSQIMTFLFGISIGAGVMYFYRPVISETKMVSKLAEKAAEISVPEQASELTFTFIDTLKTAKITIPDDNRGQPIPLQEDSRSYVLQAGSFTSEKDADTLRAQLLLLNLEASIEQVKLNSGKTRHRVVVGPFPDKGKAESSQDKLSQNNYDSLLLERAL